MSTLDGEPSHELHEHYDPDGRLTGSTLVTRPGWSDEDRAWAIGLQLHEDLRCTRCGHNLNESLDYQWKWVPDDPVICHACVAMQAAVKATEQDPRHRAMYHRLKKVPRPQPRKRKR